MGEKGRKDEKYARRNILKKYIDRNASVFRYTRLTMLFRLHSLTCICSHCLQLMPKRAGRGEGKGQQDREGDRMRGEDRQMRFASEI